MRLWNGVCDNKYKEKPLANRLRPMKLRDRDGLKSSDLLIFQNEIQGLYPVSIWIPGNPL